MISRACLSAFLLAALTSSSALGTTYVVSPDGIGDFPTIQAAINAAVDGDIIELTDGTFLGEGNRDIDCLGKAITVRSQSGDPRSCIVDCGGTDAEPHRGLRLHSGEGPESVWEGVTITNGYASDGAGLFSHGSSPTLRNCIFSHNVAVVHGGGFYSDGGSPSLINCTLTDNRAFFGGGLLCVNSLATTLRNCTLSHNKAVYGSGLHTWQSSVALENTIIAFGPEGRAVTCERGGDATLACCDIYDNTGGDWVGCIADQLGTNGNITEDPLFCDPENGDFTLHSDSPCAAENNPECGYIGAWYVGCGETSSIQSDPAVSRILTNAPNPFRHSTRITFSIPHGSDTPLHLKIYDPMGRLVRTLVRAPRPSGNHTVIWDGTNQAGVPVVAGVYLYQLVLNGETQTKRTMLVR